LNSFTRVSSPSMSAVSCIREQSAHNPSVFMGFLRESAFSFDLLNRLIHPRASVESAFVGLGGLAAEALYRFAATDFARAEPFLFTASAHSSGGISAHEVHQGIH